MTGKSSSDITKLISTINNQIMGHVEAAGKVDKELEKSAFKITEYVKK